MGPGGTKASAAKYVGNGLGVVSVNPYGCNAPATPLGTWNIDLNGLYSVSGIVMNAITIPTQGVSIQVRAAKTEADTSTWTGSNPICATVNLTTDSLGKMIKCSQTLLARYLTVIGTNLGGDGLPICSLDAIVTMPVPPNEAAPPSPGASGSSPYFPPLAPVGAPTGSAPGVSQKGSSGSGSGGSGGSSKNTSSGGSSSSSTTSSSSRSDQGEGQEYGQGGYTMDAGAMRPLNPAEVQAASSLSSAQGSPAAGSSPGRSPKISMSDGALWGICGAVILVMGVATAGITIWLIRKEKREFEAKTIPSC
ncbi:g8102 [Coccomyxa viridis]|uniref:G8102 protein n=1 Tax=Coccomyxa viridis TaxID=1274662 RepID=A0ABP1G692_9CHLO